MELKLQNIALAFGFNIVFQGVSFQLKSGELMQIKGSNGAGKSMLLNIIAGVMQPPVGHIHNTFNSSLLINENSGLKKDLRVKEQIQFWTGLARSKADPLEEWGLSMLSDVPIAHLSLGQRQRLALTKLDMSDAQLWLLDEPYHGLDQGGQEILTDKIKHKLASGGAVIMVNHSPLALGLSQTYNMKDQAYVAA